MGARGQYVTRPREWISSIPAREPRFLSAAQIYDWTRRLGMRVPSPRFTARSIIFTPKATSPRARRATVKRPTCRAAPAHHHHHAICRKCDRVEDVDCSVTDQFAQSLRRVTGSTSTTMPWTFSKHAATAADFRDARIGRVRANTAQQAGTQDAGRASRRYDDLNVNLFAQSVGGQM